MLDVTCFQTNVSSHSVCTSVVEEFISLDRYTTREKPSSSAGIWCISSAGTRATDKALQLTCSSSAC